MNINLLVRPQRNVCEGATIRAFIKHSFGTGLIFLSLPRAGVRPSRRNTISGANSTRSNDHER